MAGDAGRSGTLLRRFVIVVIVIAVFLLVADRGGDYAAERLAADHLKSSQHLQSSPDVSIDGFPFLTQFASGKYGHLSVDANAVPIGPTSDPLQFSHLHVDFNQVTVSRSFSKFHVDSATATATIDYHDLGHVLGITVRYAGGNRIEASKKFTVLGKTFDPTISVRPVLVNGTLAFAKSELNGLGQLGGEVSSALNKLFNTPVPLNGIPFDITLRSLHVDSGGIEIDLVGSNLNFSK